MTKFIDLFSGIGGFRIALENVGSQCVFSSEIDEKARETYNLNFNEYPAGDIFKINETDIPDHDILCAGFPCQPFSLAGKRLGFEDARGTLFFEIARILKYKRPKAFILENVSGIVSHDGGKTLEVIMNVLDDLDYNATWKLLNSKEYGIPQNRNRWYCIGFDRNASIAKLNLESIFPEKTDLKYTLKDVLEDNVGDEYEISSTAKKNIEKYLDEYLNKHYNLFNNDEPIIANNIRPSKVSFSSTGISPCLTAKMGTGGNNVPVIVEQNRKFTTRECLSLMGFPIDFKIKENYSQSYKQIGNSIAIPVVEQIARNLVEKIK